ncbi:MAG: Copper-sensing two-component system response regulator CpxR [Hyphomicrobiales bacterium]|nr:Copper-sensing two-component system response regulator CpxR [Hyphomicrobiales bacterium]
MVSAYLAQHGWIVDAATSLVEARRQIESQRPDVVLIALDVGSADVLAFLGELKLDGVESFVISDSSRVLDRIACLERGALDYMAKPVDLRELVLRLKRVWRSGPKANLPPNMEISCGVATLDIASRVLRGPGARPVLLTPSEFRLLYLLLRNEGRIVERVVIARDVLGHSEANLSRSVDVMVSKLRRKLGMSSSGRFVRNVRSEGYALVRDERERTRAAALLAPDIESNPAFADEL